MPRKKRGQSGPLDLWSHSWTSQAAEPITSTSEASQAPSGYPLALGFATWLVQELVRLPEQERDARWSFGQIENGLQLKIEDDEACAFTSLEIAEQTGKQHKNNMQAIRKMEPAWEKVQGLKFKLLS